LRRRTCPLAAFFLVDASSGNHVQKLPFCGADGAPVLACVHARLVDGKRELAGCTALATFERSREALAGSLHAIRMISSTSTRKHDERRTPSSPTSGRPRSRSKTCRCSTKRRASKRRSSAFALWGPGRASDGRHHALRRRAAAWHARAVDAPRDAGRQVKRHMSDRCWRVPACFPRSVRFRYPATICQWRRVSVRAAKLVSLVSFRLVETENQPHATNYLAP
jgi:hypothetical protein